MRNSRLGPSSLPNNEGLAEQPPRMTARRRCGRMALLPFPDDCVAPMPSPKLFAPILIVLAALALGGSAQAAGSPRDQSGRLIPRLGPATIDRLTRRMDADAALHRLLAVCPADVYRRRAGTAAGVSLEACGRRPDQCLAQCLDRGSPDACFTLAGIVQAAPHLDPLYGESLYQMACAAGDAAGCVNRAAGLRNASYAGDPYPKQPDARRSVCQFRSFAIGCDAGGAWGCTMRGQAYARGEGVPADVAAARRDFARACALGPLFAACTFAKKQLEELHKPAAPGAGAKTIQIRDDGGQTP